MKLFQLIRTVLWSFFGIRKRAGLEADVQSLKPLHVILTGLALAGVFVGLLITLVRFAAAHLR